MNEQLKLYTGIAVRSLGKGARVLLTGGLFSVICILTAIILFSNNTRVGLAGTPTGIAGAISGMLFLFADEFWSALLLFGSLGLMFYYSSLAMSVLLRNSVYLVWQNKLADFVTPKITAYLQRLSLDQPGWLKQISNTATLKLKLTDAYKNDPDTHVIQKRVIRYGIKKITPEDIDLQTLSMETLPGTISNVIRHKVANMAAPTLKPLWIALSVQAVILILAILFDHP